MQKNEIAVYGQNNNYLSEYQGILDDFKEIHKLMAEANGSEVYYLLTGAQKKLTRLSVEEVDKLIKDLVMNFTDQNIERFMEKVISILSSLETTKQLYGSIIDVGSIKKYISKKITILTIKRYKIIESQILKKRFIEEAKLKVLYANITNCKKVVMFAIDLDNLNIKAIEFIITMLNNLITNSTRMGVDNYTREVILLEVQSYEDRLENILRASDEDSFDDDYAKNIVQETYKNVVNEKAVEESCNMLVTLNSSNESLENQTKKLTNQFINTSNEVIENAKRSTGGGAFVNEAIRQFASVMSTVQTINYLQNGVVDINAVAKNISTQMMEMVWKEYNALKKSWSMLENKNEDDIRMFLRESNLYSDTLLKSYDIYPDNILSLKRYIDVLDNKMKNKETLKLTKDDELNLNRERKNRAETIKRRDPNYKLIELDQKKKKSIFSMFWGK